MTGLQIFVPREGSMAAGTIPRASGVVGASVDQYRVSIVYESNSADSARLATWAARVKHAAQRHATSEADDVRCTFATSDLISVGTVTIEDETIQLKPGILRDKYVRRWCGLALESATKVVSIT